jgi:hypothetical protein
MQICAPTPNPNHDYKCLTKEFVEKYVNANLLGIGCIGYYYNNNAMCSIHLHQGSVNELHEMVGHTNFMHKLKEIGVSTIKYHDIVPTSQPVGKNSILITFFGQAEINGRNHNLISTFIVRMVADAPRIVNQTLNIFL